MGNFTLLVCIVKLWQTPCGFEKRDVRTSNTELSCQRSTVENAVTSSNTLWRSFKSYIKELREKKNWRAVGIWCCQEVKNLRMIRVWTSNLFGSGEQHEGSGPLLLCMVPDGCFAIRLHFPYSCSSWKCWLHFGLPVRAKTPDHWPWVNLTLFKDVLMTCLVPMALTIALLVQRRMED